MTPLAAAPPPSARIHIPLGHVTGSPFVIAAIILILLIVVATAVHRVRSRGRPQGPPPDSLYGPGYGTNPGYRTPPGYGAATGAPPPPVTGSGRSGPAVPDPSAGPPSLFTNTPPRPVQDTGASPWGEAPGGPAAPPPPPGAPPGAPPGWFTPQPGQPRQPGAPESPYGGTARPDSRFVPPPQGGRPEPEASTPAWDDTADEPPQGGRQESGGTRRYGRPASSGISGDNPVDPNYSGPGDWDGGPADPPEYRTPG